MPFWPFLLLQVIVFIVLVFVLRRILAHHLMDASGRLQALSAEYIRRQEELKQRLEEAEQQYMEQMTRAKTEADQIVSKARQETESSRVQLLQEARSESERIVQQGLESRQAIQKELEQRMEARAIERACEMVQEILPGQLRMDMQSHWLDELIHNGLAQLQSVTTQDHIHEARVVSALPLNPHQRQAIGMWLKGKLGREITLMEATDAMLIAGLTITIGSLVLDGSLSYKLRQVARRVGSNP